VDQQVQSAVARGLAGNPCAGLRHLGVNLETMTQQAYPEGWFGRVAASLQLTAEQRSVLKAAWGKIAVDRAALLARHEVLTQMQQQQAAMQQEFGARMIKANERCVATMQKRMQALLVPSAAAAAGVAETSAAHQAVQTGMCSTSSSRLNNAANNTNHNSRVQAGGCSSSCSGGSSSSTASMASAEAAAAICCNTCLAGAMASVRLEQPASRLLFQSQAPPTPAAAAAAAISSTGILSMTCDVQGPFSAAAKAAATAHIAAAAAAADTSALASHPEVLMCAPRPGQAALQGKLSGVRASLGLLYSWAGLLAYNALSRKQLAVAAVTSYPFAFDPVAGEGAGCTASYTRHCRCRASYTRHCRCRASCQGDSTHVVRVQQALL
jgi:hypothetical protein